MQGIGEKKERESTLEKPNTAVSLVKVLAAQALLVLCHCHDCRVSERGLKCPRTLQQPGMSDTTFFKLKTNLLCLDTHWQNPWIACACVSVRNARAGDSVYHSRACLHIFLCVCTVFAVFAQFSMCLHSCWSKTYCTVCNKLYCTTYCTEFG